jgi:hypothetical protein
MNPEIEYTQEEEEAWLQLAAKESFPFPTREQMERLEREASKVKGSSLGAARLSLDPLDQED